MMAAKIFTITFFLFLPIMLYAGLEKKLNESWRWRSFDKVSGLPSNHIFNLIETPGGVLWALTPKGMAWYDRFTWRHVPGLDEILEPEVKAAYYGETGLAICSRGKLYLFDTSASQKREAIFDNKDLFIQKAVHYGWKSLLLLARDPDSAESNIFLVQGDKIGRYPLPANIGKIVDVYRTGDDNLWIVTGNKIYLRSGEGWEQKLDTGKDTLSVSNIFSDRKGNDFFFINKPIKYTGIWSIERDSLPKHIIPQKNYLLLPLDFSEDNRSIAFCSNGEIKMFEDGKLTELRAYPPPLTGALCYSFTSSGDLFIGTAKGIYMCKYSSDLWSRLKADENKFNNINEILALEDEVWAATGGGIVIYNSNGDYRKIVRINGRRLGAVTGLVRDDEGHIWISSGGDFEGAFRWDGRKWDHFGAGDGLRAGRIHKIFNDNHGSLWFLSVSPKVNRGNCVSVLKDGKFINWADENDFGAKYVYAFTRDSTGKFWFGTQKGVWCFNAGRWKHWTTANGLRHNDIFTMATSPEGRVWFGSRASGAGFFINGRPHYEPAIDSAEIYSVWNLVFDSGGVMWLATHYGLFNYYQGSVASLNGMASILGSRIWPVHINDDKIYIGSIIGGISILNRKEESEYPPEVFFGEAVAKEGLATLNWKVFSYMANVPSDKVYLRYRIDGRKWSKWGLHRNLILNNLQAGDHNLQVQARSYFGKPYSKFYGASFNVPSPFYHRIEFILPLVFLAIVSIVALVYYNLYKVKKASNEIIETKNKRITESKNLLEEKNELIKKQYARLEELNNTKDMFFSIIAHDLINPLGSFSEVTRFMAENIRNMQPEEIESFITEMKKTSEYLYALLENLLQWSRVQLGTINFFPVVVYMKSIIEENIEIYKDRAESKGISFYVDVNDECSVFADPNMVSTIVRNLLSNAVKYTKEGGKIEIKSSGDDKSVYITVKDNGIGMNSEDMKKLFRIDLHYKTLGTYDEKGTGLGLILCKEFADKNGGEISVNSSLGKGSAFTISFPKYNQKD